MKFWGKNGAFWEGNWGWLVGAGFFLIPGIGHIIVLGPLVGWIAGALEGATLGAGIGVLGAALASAGIPKDSIVKYETAIGAGKFVVTAHGTPAEVDRARFSPPRYAGRRDLRARPAVKSFDSCSDSVRNPMTNQGIVQMTFGAALVTLSVATGCTHEQDGARRHPDDDLGDPRDGVVARVARKGELDDLPVGSAAQGRATSRPSRARRTRRNSTSTRTRSCPTIAMSLRRSRNA